MTGLSIRTIRESGATVQEVTDCLTRQGYLVLQIPAGDGTLSGLRIESAPITAGVDWPR